MTHLPSFGELLRRHRVAAGLSQEVLAEAAHVSARSISDLERGLNLRPHQDTVALLGVALKLSAQEREALAATVVRGRRARGVQPPPPVEPPRTLPAQPTPLLGRAPDIAAVSASLANPEVRLITLTGPGGVGKTRLALRVADEVQDRFVDGVGFVALAPVEAPALVAPTIARALGLHVADERLSADELTAYLRAKTYLLVLDNFEHVMAAAPLIADLLAACPRLTMVITSRAALRVRAEHEYTVAPLAVPPSLPLPATAAPVPPRPWLDYPAIELFVQRARAVKPNFVLGEAVAPFVAAICRRLDGLPLALELAAARARVLSPPELYARLLGTSNGAAGNAGAALRLLTDGARDLPARQHTLRATIDWSYDLLAPVEQALFRRLSVFTGGCMLEEAEAVCAPRDGVAEASPDTPDVLDVLDGLSSLVDKSLLRQEDHPAAGDAGGARFVMLQTVLEYARERLAASGEEDLIRRRHLAYVVTSAEYVEPRLTGPDQRAWHERLETEHDNLRAALRWSIVAGDGESGLRIVAALWRFWWLRGYLSEGRRWLAELLAIAPGNAAGAGGVSGVTRARALHGGAWLAHAQGDLAQATALAEESLALMREAGDTSGSASALNVLGVIAADQGYYERAAVLARESLALFEESGHKSGAASVLNGLGIIAAERGDFTRAALWCERSLALRREVGDVRGIAASLSNLARLQREQGHVERAAALYEQSLDLFRDLGGKRDLAAALNNAGEMARCVGDDARAAELSRESVALYRELGDKWGLGLALADLANLARRQGDAAHAMALYRESLTFCQAVSNRLGFARSLEGIAATVFQEGDATTAALLYGAAATARAAIDTPMSPADRIDHEPTLAAIQAAMSETERLHGSFDSAWLQGRTATVDALMVLVYGNSA